MYGYTEKWRYKMSAPYYQWFTDFVVKEKIKTMAEIGILRGKLTLKILKTLNNSIEQYWAIDPWKPYPEFFIKTKSEEKWWPQDRWDQLHYSLCKYYPWFPALRIMRLTSFPTEETIFLMILSSLR